MSNVNNEFNAVYVHGQAVGEVMFYGPGAGKLPTGSAVVSDIISIVKNMNQVPKNKSALKEPEPYELQGMKKSFRNISYVFHYEMSQGCYKK